MPSIDDQVKELKRLKPEELAGRMNDLDLATRAALIDALQKGRTGKRKERMIRDVILATRGDDLTVLKNAIDAGGDYHDLQQLVFTDVDDLTIRGQILEHIAREAGPHGSAGVKVVSDIDDTVFNRINDKRYPKKTVYAGVLQFYKELGGERGGNLVFLTARPKVRTGHIEDHAHRTLRGLGLPEATILSGDFLNLTSNQRMADRKYRNFTQYQSLFPEYYFIFIGDSGQGDALFGARIREDFPAVVKAVFIHDVRVATAEERAAEDKKGVYFIDTYVGGAVKALELGLITPEGLGRIVEVAREDFAKIVFENDDQKLARVSELDADVKRATALMA